MARCTSCGGSGRIARFSGAIEDCPKCKPVMEWQPIETAPKDGTEVLLCDARFEDAAVGAAMFIAGAWRCYYPHDGGIESVWPSPTHWMPLPAPVTV
jgi:phage FluMu protein Com